MLTSILKAIGGFFSLVSGAITLLTRLLWKKAGADQQALSDVKEQDHANEKAKAVSDAAARDLARDPGGVMRDDGFERK